MGRNVRFGRESREEGESHGGHGGDGGHGGFLGVSDHRSGSSGGCRTSGENVVADELLRKGLARRARRFFWDSPIAGRGIGWVLT
jgi:hypothetical protein